MDREANGLGEALRFWDSDFYAPVEISGYPLGVALLEHGMNRYAKAHQVSSKHLQVLNHVRGARGKNQKFTLYKGISFHGTNPYGGSRLDFHIHMRYFPERIREMWRGEYTCNVLGHYSCILEDELNEIIVNTDLNKLFEPVGHQSGEWSGLRAALSERIMLLLLEEAVEKVSREDENRVVLFKNQIISVSDNPDIAERYKTSELDALILFWRPTNFVRVLRTMRSLTKEIDVWYREELKRT